MLYITVNFFVTICIWFMRIKFIQSYSWLDTSAGGLLVHERIICICFGTDMVYSIYCLSKFSSYVTGDRSRFWLSCLDTLALSVPYEGYSRNVSCALNLISTLFFNLQSGYDFTSIPKTRTWCTAPTDILQYLLL
jgi:hypothetical protein